MESRTPIIVAVALALTTVTFGPVATAGHGAGTITVDDDGPSDFDTIQAAVDHANAGDTIEVAPGTYAEDVTVDVTDLDLVGANAGIAGDDPRSAESTVDGQVVVSASGAVLDGFDISPPDPTTNQKGEALRISNTPDDVVVRNNVVRDFDGSGLPDWEGADAIVAFGGNAGDAIEDVTITRNKVENIQGNAVKGGATGVSIQGNVQGATVQDNVVDNVGMEATGWAFGLVVRGTGNHDQVPSAVTLEDNEVSRLLSNPSTSTVGVGFGFEADDVDSTDLHFNQFEDNELHVENKASSMFDATHNWWGSHNGTQPDQTDGPVDTSFHCGQPDCNGQRRAHAAGGHHNAGGNQNGQGNP